MVLWTMFFLLTIKYIKRADLRLRKIEVLGIFFIIICTTYWVLGISTASLAYCMVRPFVFFSPIIALIILDQCDNDSQIKFLFHFISLTIAINIADSIWITHNYGIEDLVYQNLAENLEEEGLHLNLGGSLYVNMIVFYANVMFFTFLCMDNKKERFLFFLYFSISAYFIIMCSLKASAILLFLISTFLQFVACKGGKNLGFIIFVSIISIGIFFIIRDNIINFLIDIIGSERIASRLEVFATGASATDNTSFAGRENLWQTSLLSWLKSPITFIFGIGDRNWSDYVFTADSGIGDHSDLLDVLARYGILGGSILYTSLILLYRYFQEYYGSFFKWQIISFFILVFLMGLTKKFVSGEPAIVLFILFPLCLKYLYNQKLKKAV